MINCKKEQSSNDNESKLNQSIIEETESAMVVETPEKEVGKLEELYGNWVGDFNAEEFGNQDDRYSHSNKINIKIEFIDNDNHIRGKSIVAGNERPFNGKIEETDNGYSIQLNEPGDDKYDGVFEMNVTPEKDSIYGSWTAFNQKIAVTKRVYGLNKRDFKYDKDLMVENPDEIYEDMEDSGYIDWYKSKKVTEEYIDDDGEKHVYTYDAFRSSSDMIYKINASNTKLKADDLKNLKKLDLEIIRNTIFARHGYSFKKLGFRQFFDWIDWYVPISNNVGDELTDLEKENIALLQRFEKYAEDNYDAFGR